MARAAFAAGCLPRERERRRERERGGGEPRRRIGLDLHAIFSDRFPSTAVRLGQGRRVADPAAQLLDLNAGKGDGAARTEKQIKHSGGSLRKMQARVRGREAKSGVSIEKSNSLHLITCT